MWETRLVLTLAMGKEVASAPVMENKPAHRHRHSSAREIVRRLRWFPVRQLLRGILGYLNRARKQAYYAALGHWDRRRPLEKHHLDDRRPSNHT